MKRFTIGVVYRFTFHYIGDAEPLSEEALLSAFITHKTYVFLEYKVVSVAGKGTISFTKNHY